MGGRGRLGVLRASAEMDAVVATIGEASQNLVVQGNPVEDAEVLHVEPLPTSLLTVWGRRDIFGPYSPRE
jgi:hypothetical protein